MSRDKIDEMARSLCLLKKDTCEDCTMNEHCLMRNCAECFYNAGYRKASDVARETVEAIKAEARKKEQYVNDLFGYGGYLIATTDLEDIIRKYIFDTYEEDELKKKYESEKENEI